MLRLKYAKFLTVLVVAINVLLIFYTWKWFLSNESTASSTIGIGQRQKSDRTHTSIKHIKKTITIIFRDFYHFENDLQHSIESILNLLPNIQIMVIYEDEPYPPLTIMTNFTQTHPNVRFINLNFDIRKSAKSLTPLTQIRTKYLLFVPDSFRFGGRAILHKMLNEIEKKAVQNNNKKSNTAAAVAVTTAAIAQQSDSNNNNNNNSDGNNDKNKTKIQMKKIVIMYVSIFLAINPSVHRFLPLLYLANHVNAATTYPSNPVFSVG